MNIYDGFWSSPITPIILMPSFDITDQESLEKCNNGIDNVIKLLNKNNITQLAQDIKTTCQNQDLDIKCVQQISNVVFYLYRVAETDKTFDPVFLIDACDGNRLHWKTFPTTLCMVIASIFTSALSATVSYCFYNIGYKKGKELRLDANNAVA